VIRNSGGSPCIVGMGDFKKLLVWQKSHALAIRARAVGMKAPVLTG